jgi:MoaA/NifB/PqqE/SkfB family radical SAM enzyme
MSAVLLELPSRTAPEGLEAFDRYVPRPGHPDWLRLDAEAEALAAEILPTLERPRTGPREWFRRARSWATGIRTYFRNLLRHWAGRQDLLPLYFVWTTLRACNFACTYCDDHRGRKYPDLPTAGTLNTADAVRLLQIMRTGTSSLYFAGGEPTLRNDLPTLTRTARDLNYYPLIINTNAALVHTRLKQERWRGWLADMDLVLVSLDGLTLEWLGRTWVTKKPEDVVRNLLLLKRLSGPLGFKLMVNTVIQPAHIKEASDVFDLCQDLGIWFTPVPVNVGPRIVGGLHGNADYERLVERIMAASEAGGFVTGSPRLNERLLHSAPLNCRNTLKPHIDYDGTLVWPCKATVNVEPEAVDVLNHTSVDSLYTAAVARIDPTGFQGDGPEQCGAECNWAQNYSTDAYAHGLEHPMELLKTAWNFIK